MSNIYTKITDISKRHSFRLNHSLLRPNNSINNEVILNNTKNDIDHGVGTTNNGMYEMEMAHSGKRFSSNNLNNLFLKTSEKAFLPKSTISKITSEKDLLDITFDDNESEENFPKNFEGTKTKHPLADAVVFVDVRAENENRSKAISRELEHLGATIAERIGGHVTHVVFKDGRSSTLNQLKKYPHIHFVSVLWVDSCKTLKCKVNEGLYPVRYLGSKECLPMAKAKRVKSLQPKTFDEDVNNSAKREERRKRRFKKLDKNYGTPLDQVICLDSQEYIKSSDLYKLVATPLAIPDTPWIINYINGSPEDTTSPDGLCSNLNKSNVDMLSQDVQCRLTFQHEISSPSPSKKRNTCLISLGTSPSESNRKENDVIKTNNNHLDILCSSPLKRTSVPTQAIASVNDAILGDKIVSIPQIRNSQTCTLVCGTASEVECFQQKMKSELKEKNTVHNTIIANEIFIRKDNITVNNRIKKKKLLSKTGVALSQEKLISPALKDGGNEIKGVKKKQTTGDAKRKHVTISTNRNCPPNAFTMIQQLQISKKDRKVEKIHDNEKDIESDQNCIVVHSVDDREEERAKLYTPKRLLHKNDTTEIIQCLSTESEEITDVVSVCADNIKNIDKAPDFREKTSSAIENRDALYLEMETPSNPTSLVKDNSVVDCPSQEILQETSPPLNIKRRRSKRKSVRNSAIHFKVSKNFRKPDISKYFRMKSNKENEGKEESTTVDNERNAENIILQAGNIDHNFSVGNDETEGLVCASHKDGVFKLENSKESGSKVELQEDGPSTSFSTIPTGLSIVFDSDSSISDSEEKPNGNKTNGPTELKLPSNQVNVQRRPKQSQNQNKNHMKPSNVNAMSSSNGTVNTNVNNATKRPKHSIVFTSLHYGEQHFAKNVIKDLGGFKLKMIVARDTTHLVSGEGRRTLNILHAIVKGCWILSPKWVSDSLEEGCYLDEENYEMSKEFPYAKISRLNRIRNGISSCSTLFIKLPRIYLAEVTSPSHEEMMRLIASCGGKLTNTVRKAGIAIGMVTCRKDNLRIVSEKWILDSITYGRIMPTKTYEYRGSFRSERSPDF